MIKSLIPDHLRKDWLLHFSGFLTWSVITFLSLNNLGLGIEFCLKFLALLVFYISFAVIISSKTTTHPVNDAETGMRW